MGIRKCKGKHSWIFHLCVVCLGCSSDQAVSRWRVRDQNSANACSGLLVELNQRQWQYLIFYCCKLAAVVDICLLICTCDYDSLHHRHTIWHSDVVLYQVKQLLPQLTSKQRISIKFISCVPAKERNLVVGTHWFGLSLYWKKACSHCWTMWDYESRPTPLLPQTVFSACCERVWSHWETSATHFGFGSRIPVPPGQAAGARVILSTSERMKYLPTLLVQEYCSWSSSFLYLITL